MLNTVKIFRGLRRIVVFPKVVLLEVYPQSVRCQSNKFSRDLCPVAV
jgi:hypothetical protein